MQEPCPVIMTYFLNRLKPLILQHLIIKYPYLQYKHIILSKGRHLITYKKGKLNVDLVLFLLSSVHKKYDNN